MPEFDLTQGSQHSANPAVHPPFRDGLSQLDENFTSDPWEVCDQGWLAICVLAYWRAADDVQHNKLAMLFLQMASYFLYSDEKGELWKGTQ